MKYFLIAGERSGDLHASNLMKALLQYDGEANFRYFGGDQMAEVSGSPIVHYREMAFMGFWEVVQNLGTIRRYLQRAKDEIAEYQPDALILIDYGGFNMKVARFAKSQGIKVHYYILPKIWAWNQKRAIKLKASVDFMYSILPFEPDFYRNFGVEHIEYVGNPILQAIDSFEPTFKFLEKLELTTSSKIIAVLPGSRAQELRHIFPVLTTTIRQNPDKTFLIAAVTSLPSGLYKEIGELGNCMVIFDETYNILSCSNAAIVTSGTATLETALLNIPQVVVYKTSVVSYAIARIFIKVKYISLVNLIMNSQCVTELIQQDFSPQRLSIELERILTSPTDYSELKTMVGSLNASQITARAIIKAIKAG